ncbi:RHS repeat domain-containing protein, partial [Leptospira interrogans]
NEFGQTAGFTLGNGIATSYGYDVKGRMVRLNSSGDVDGNNKVLQDAVYSFNPNNNITRIANNSTDWNAQYDYDYDGIGRLTNAVGIHVETTESNLTKRFQQSYSYAKNGNLTSKRIHDPASGNVTDEWSYVYANHQVTNIDSSKSGNDALVMQYDASGNLTRQRDNAKDLTKRISVDSQDRITQIQDGNNAILGNYWYDDGGFRIRKSSLEPKNNQFANVEILYPSKFYGLEFIEAENVLTSVNNIYLNGVRIAAMNEAGALAYFLTDQVDSVSHALDDEGKTLSKMQYLPYGETFVQRGDTNFAPKYNSQELDRESGFYFYNARYYDPGIARFTSADTIIDGEFDTQGWNRFSYVKGNPITFKDPTGHDTFLYFYKSETTESGAGHVAVGVGNTKKQTLYEANPENSNPISPMEKTYKHEGSMDEVLKKNHIGSKGKNPDLILQLKTDSKGAEDGKIKETAEKFFEKNKNWTVYNANCTDLAKQGTAQTKYKNGKAPISTPTDFANDLHKNNQEAIKSGDIKVLKGDFQKYKDGTGSANGVSKVLVNDAKEATAKTINDIFK